MATKHPIPAAILAIALLARPGGTASAHPSSGIVIDGQGQVYFQDIAAGAIWKIDARGNLTKYHDKLGGHWMALDEEGVFSRAEPRLIAGIRPIGARPTLLVADGGAPIAVNPDGHLYYGHTFLEGGGVAIGLMRIAPDGRRTSFSPQLKKALEEKDDGVFGLAVGPDRSLYVSTWDAVLRVGRDGSVTTVARPVVVVDCDADPADHKASNRLPLLRGLAVDARGTVYAAATSCHRTLRIAPDGKVESIVRAERPWSPTGVALHGGALYVLEYTNANGGPDEGWRPRVRRLGRDGRLTILATLSRQP